jgi:predicted transcriptional regulator
MSGMNDDIRAAVVLRMAERGVTRYQMAQDLDMDAPNISRLLNGRSGKIPESWQAIFDYLGLELVVKPKP